jgi:hypothetical protein
MAYTDIDKPDDYFNTVLYTGDGGINQYYRCRISILTVVWLKSRNNAYCT